LQLVVFNLQPKKFYFKVFADLLFLTQKTA